MRRVLRGPEAEQPLLTLAEPSHRRGRSDGQRPGANANIGAEPFQMALLPLLPDASFDFGIGEAQADSALPTRVEQERARRARHGIVGSVGVTEAPTVDSIPDELGHGRSVLIEEDVGVTRHWNAQGRARLARADLGSSQQRLERLAVEL